MAKQSHTNSIDDRPDIEVLVDGTWCPGDLRQCIETDGQRIFNVSWRQTVGQTRLDNSPGRPGSRGIPRGAAAAEP